MRILITGGAGFLGSHLCDRLIKADCDVICLDNFFTGRKQNIAHLLEHPRFELMRHDIIDPFKIEVDQIYNLACPASPVHYQFNPIKTVKTSGSWAPINCLRPRQAPAGAGFPRPARARFTAIRRCTRRPKAIGGTSTRSASAHVMTKASAAPRRCFSIITAKTRWISASCASSTPTARACSPTMAAWCRTSSIPRALKGENLTVYGDGMQTRSFCYVDDLIEGFVRFMNQTETIGPLNLGNPCEFTMLQLAELTLQMVGGKSKIMFTSRCPPTTRKQRKPDIALAQKVLKWEANRAARGRPQAHHRVFPQAGVSRMA